jgi:hypothetical protein
MTAKIKRGVRAFCDVMRELEMPLIRIYILVHLFKSLFHH